MKNNRLLFLVITLLSVILIALVLNRHFSTKKTGLEIYRVKMSDSNSITQSSSCQYCFDPTKEDLFESPLLTDSDIESFDWNNQQIKLSKTGLKKISDLEIPLKGLPVVFVLNGEIIYGFWFWNMVSSFGCDRVFTYPKLDFKIKFGLPPDNAYGNDPRFDQRLKNYLTNKN